MTNCNLNIDYGVSEEYLNPIMWKSERNNVANSFSKVAWKLMIASKQTIFGSILRLIGSSSDKSWPGFAFISV